MIYNSQKVQEKQSEGKFVHRGSLVLFLKHKSREQSQQGSGSLTKATFLEKILTFRPQN